MSELTDKFEEELKNLHCLQQDALPIWQTDYMKCPICEHKFVSVHPKDMEQGECPCCHNFFEPNNDAEEERDFSLL